MEPILLIVSSWWWVAPAAAGVGAVSYAGLTTRSRRARRLELDAARHEESHAYRELVAAKARVRAAHAALLAAKAHGTAAQTIGARHTLQIAKQSAKSASLALRATRSRVKGVRAQYVASSSRDPLPIDRLYAAHDTVNARWLAYETDVDKALAFPQLTDSRHPSTVAFLRAQREALARRPMLRDRVSPQQYAEYRAAVEALEAALTEAERQAGVPGAARTPSATASVASAAAAALAVLAGRLPSLLPKPPAARGDGVPPDRAP